MALPAARCRAAVDSDRQLAGSACRHTPAQSAHSVQLSHRQSGVRRLSSGRTGCAARGIPAG